MLRWNVDSPNPIGLLVATAICDLDLQSLRAQIQQAAMITNGP